MSVKALADGSSHTLTQTPAASALTLTMAAQAIAGFLDLETGKIDELAAEQRRLIELLKEKRQAVISHAVTKGLNPQAATKLGRTTYQQAYDLTRLYGSTFEKYAYCLKGQGS